MIVTKVDIVKQVMLLQNRYPDITRVRQLISKVLENFQNFHLTNSGTRQLSNKIVLTMFHTFQNKYCFGSMRLREMLCNLQWIGEEYSKDKAKILLMKHIHGIYSSYNHEPPSFFFKSHQFRF